MTRAGTFILLCALSAGCLAGRIKTEASGILNCPESSIRVVERESRTYEAIGCGRAAICRAPDVEGADLFCAGGGPIK